eukprot:747778-Hanusia_phi.AAC.2
MEVGVGGGGISGEVGLAGKVVGSFFDNSIEMPAPGRPCSDGENDGAGMSTFRSRLRKWSRE